MTYQVLPRKYRPANFKEVIGQEEVTRTLENAISNGRLANAYIFCGPRGIGKTSVARLVAKKLNCQAKPEESPCGKCESCRDAMRVENMDVLEIDGASNNSVDQVRVLRENVKFTPAKSKYKIYIIDEVHMLSAGAFNALLKTLEEPPEHVKFIFATTEAHKVPATILSRCQRFDFRKIPPAKIRDNLLRVAKKEKISIHPEAALLIARASDGSLRDSLVMLEQMHSFSRGEISSEEVIDLLGMVRNTHLNDLSGAVMEGDAAQALKVLDAMISAGGDVQHITDSLIGYVRDMMVLKTCGDFTSDMAFTEEEKALLSSQVEKTSLEEIIYIMQHLTVCSNLVKSVIFSRAPLELALIKLANRKDMLALPEVLKRLEELNSRTLPAVDQGKPRVKKTSPEKKDQPVKPREESQSVPAEENAADVEKSGADSEEIKDLPDPDYKKIAEQWAAVLKLVQKIKMSAATFLQVARPVEIEGNELVIGFAKKDSFSRDALEEESNKAILLEAIRKVDPGISRIKLVIKDLMGGEEEKDEKPAPKPSLGKVRPVIEDAMDVFGGRVIRDYMEESS